MRITGEFPNSSRQKKKQRGHSVSSWQGAPGPRAKKGGSCEILGRLHRRFRKGRL